MAKFILSLSSKNFQILSDIAAQRGTKVQELVRAVIIPDWFDRVEERRETLERLQAKENRVLNTQNSHRPKPTYQPGLLPRIATQAKTLSRAPMLIPEQSTSNHKIRRSLWKTIPQDLDLGKSD